MHSPIFLKDISLSFPHKTCFENFTTTLYPGARIGVIGRNGAGKSALLLMLQGLVASLEDVRLGSVPQIIETAQTYSGGELFQRALTAALATDPNLLLLDEPTNHLDVQNRGSLIRLLRAYRGTLIVASHDPEFLGLCVDTLWHIDQQSIVIFKGSYEAYQTALGHKREALESELQALARAEKTAHQDLMREQTRALKSRSQGQKSIQQRKWPTVVSTAKATRAEETSGRKRADLARKKEGVLRERAALAMPEVLTPNFLLPARSEGRHVLVSITDGGAGYGDTSVLSGLYLSLMSGERLVIEGRNGAGKSTLVRAIMGDPEIVTTGAWHVPIATDIGYLDQHYRTLDPTQSVMESIETLVSWSHAEIRRHLNAFLFRKNEEVAAHVGTLSGGEKARLALAMIAAKPPKLLILDEITNNLDWETRAHVVQILRAYPGAMILISHDAVFLKEVGVERAYAV